MRRGRVFLYLGLILVLLMAGGYLVYQNFLQPAPAASDPAQEAVPVDTVDVVVITQKAPRGTVLNETVLGLIPLPRDLVIGSMFTDLAQVVGRQAKFDLDSGIPLTANMLVDSASQLSDAGSVAALSIPEGMVAKSIPIGRLASVSFALRPGDRVIVIASMSFVDLDSDFQTLLPNQSAVVLGSQAVIGAEGGAPRLTSEIVGSESGSPIGRTYVDEELPEENFYEIPSESQRPRLAAQTIIPSAIVLKVGDFDYDDSGAGPAPTPTPLPEGEEVPAPVEEKVPDNITLIVTPQEAVTLTYLLDSGVDLSLALRSAGDSTVIDTSTTTLQYFLDEYAIPLPAKLPYAIGDSDGNGQGGGQPEAVP
jgi:pilus assembly protein CpaB